MWNVVGKFLGWIGDRWISKKKEKRQAVERWQAAIVDAATSLQVEMESPPGGFQTHLLRPTIKELSKLRKNPPAGLPVIQRLKIENTLDELVVSVFSSDPKRISDLLEQLRTVCRK